MPPATPRPRPVECAAAIQIASVIPSQSAAGSELWLLKERNRLTAYADTAIAEGSSEALASLWASLRDPEMERLRHGVQTEIIRVQNHYARISRLPDEFRLPVAELFPGQAVRTEADLQPPQLIALLRDLKRPMFVRARAAYVLGGHPTQAVGEALMDALKNDPSLDVAREAQRHSRNFLRHWPCRCCTRRRPKLGGRPVEEVSISCPPERPCQDRLSYAVRQRHRHRQGQCLL